MHNIIIIIINLLIVGLVDGGNAVLNILPDSPFQNVQNIIDKDLLGYVNWVIPLDLIVVTLTTWLIAIAGYYLYATILRWIKAIE